MQGFRTDCIGTTHFIRALSTPGAATTETHFFNYIYQLKKKLTLNNQMKNLFGFLILCSSFALTSCGNDEPKCDLDFTGTFIGTETCTTILGGSSAGDRTEVNITGTDGDYKIDGGSA